MTGQALTPRQLRASLNAHAALVAAGAVDVARRPRPWCVPIGPVAPTLLPGTFRQPSEPKR